MSERIFQVSTLLLGTKGYIIVDMLSNPLRASATDCLTSSDETHMVDWELVKQPHVSYARLVLEFELAHPTAAMIAVFLSDCKPRWHGSRITSFDQWQLVVLPKLSRVRSRLITRLGWSLYHYKINVKFRFLSKTKRGIRRGVIILFQSPTRLLAPPTFRYLYETRYSSLERSCEEEYIILALLFNKV